ncbi:hypothetical protein MMC28_003422 [Mycoblastus sanguinarius]|nr:hypothetical protein [Mycoblastus sanguinarius]
MTHPSLQDIRKGQIRSVDARILPSSLHRLPLPKRYLASERLGPELLLEARLRKQHHAFEFFLTIITVEIAPVELQIVISNRARIGKYPNRHRISPLGPHPASKTAYPFIQQTSFKLQDTFIALFRSCDHPLDRQTRDPGLRLGIFQAKRPSTKRRDRRYLYFNTTSLHTYLQLSIVSSIAIDQNPPSPLLAASSSSFLSTSRPRLKASNAIPSFDHQSSLFGESARVSQETLLKDRRPQQDKIYHVRLRFQRRKNEQARDYFHLPSIDTFQRRALQSSDPTAPLSASTYKLPSVDFSQQQASAQYWPGASTSTPATTAQALGTLPTPPSDGTDGFKPPDQGRAAAFSTLATATIQQPGMVSNLEPTGASSSLSARRPAANNLPSFELPLPFGSQIPQKYAPMSGLNATTTTTNQAASVSVGNLLTPPSTVPNDNLSPISSLSGTLSGSNNTQGLPPYSNFSWPALTTGLHSGLTPLGGGSGNTPQPWQNSLHGIRGMFSPSLSSSLARGNSNSPSTTEGLPPPPSYDFTQLPPFSTSMSMSMPGPASLPAIAAQQQQQQHQAITQFMTQTQTQTQTPVSATTTQASPVNGTDSYTQRPQSTGTNFYSASQPSSAQQSNFPPFNSNSSPVQQSPMSAPPHGPRISPMNIQTAAFPPPSQANPFGGRNPTFTYGQLPAMTATTQINGPIMSNIHNPGNPMGIIGMPSHGLPGGLIPGYHSGHAAQMQQQMYNPQQTPHNERPFKCDQCPQSFNRNHDLKRHKRIHLAVKPFPCGFCDKSFSRKDALKRHILVKGCGKGTPTSATREKEESPDPVQKSESDDDDTSPILVNNPT